MSYFHLERPLKAISLAISIATALRRSPPTWLVFLILGLMVVNVGLITVCVFLLFAAPFILIGVWQEVSPWMASPLIRFTATILFLIVGAVFYLIRTAFPKIYGVVEIGVGVGGCWAGLGIPSSNSFGAGLALVGGVYIIVRGINHIITARKLFRLQTKPLQKLA